jgi:fermentation-respiration switch protein FrsA (DUF1100 family)
MFRVFRLLIAFVFLMSLMPAANPAAAYYDADHPDKAICEQFGGTFTMDEDGSTICYWIPGNWNTDLVIFAHGYEEPRVPVGIPWGQLVLPDGTSLPKIINTLGFAFGVTSYSKNGLAVKEGVTGVFKLASIFREANPNTRRIYLVGASEGGAVTTLALEKDALQPTRVFSGGMSTCGPVGDFVKQVNYWGDFRLIFDHYFPGIIPVPGGVLNPVINIDPLTIAAWSTPQPWPLPAQPGPLQAAVVQALSKDFTSALKLIAVTKAPVDILHLQTTVAQTTLGLLGYNILSTDEGRQELSGNVDVDLSTNDGSPYSNEGREFKDPNGTPIEVTTYNPDELALEELGKNYTTTGLIKVPLVGLHTTGDPIVPYWHELLYQKKTLDAGTAKLFTNIPILRYGHCNFKPSEAIFAFVIMVIRASSSFSILQEVNAALPDASSQQEFQLLKDAYPDLFQVKVFIPFIRR